MIIDFQPDFDTNESILPVPDASSFGMLEGFIELSNRVDLVIPKTDFHPQLETTRFFVCEEE